MKLMIVISLIVFMFINEQIQHSYVRVVLKTSETSYNDVFRIKLEQNGRHISATATNLDADSLLTLIPYVENGNRDKVAFTVHGYVGDIIDYSYAEFYYDGDNVIEFEAALTASNNNDGNLVVKEIVFEAKVDEIYTVIDTLVPSQVPNVYKGTNDSTTLGFSDGANQRFVILYKGLQYYNLYPLVNFMSSPAGSYLVLHTNEHRVKFVLA